MDSSQTEVYVEMDCNQERSPGGNFCKETCHKHVPFCSVETEMPEANTVLELFFAQNPYQKFGKKH